MTNSLLITPAVLVSMKARSERPKESEEEIRQLIRETLVETYCLDAGKEQEHGRKCRSNDDLLKARAPWTWCDHCLRYWVREIIQSSQEGKAAE